MNFQREHIVTLRDGRRLSYEQAGSPYGRTVFYFHSSSSARCEWKMWANDDLLKSANIKLIAIDRPGVGLSDFYRKRQISEWQADVLAVADELNIDRFSVLGYAGGGAYAAACARYIPERLVNVALVSGVAPFYLPGMQKGMDPAYLQFLRNAGRPKWLHRFRYNPIRHLAKSDPARYFEHVLAGCGPADLKVLNRPEVYEAMFAALGTSHGQQVDTVITMGPWEFELREIATHVQVWHGKEDRKTSMAMFRYLTRAIPNVSSYLLPDEGHISLIVNYSRLILLGLVEQDIQAAP